MVMLNPRAAYGEALVEQGKKNKNIVALEADVGNSTRSLLFQAEFPDRHFDMGIAEQNMAATAAGLSLAGNIPFINSFAVFVAGRAYDQIRQSVCIPRLNVKICGTSAGLSDFGDGASHQAVEDIAMMRALPNMTVLVSADAVETRKMVKAMALYEGPVYIRVCRNDIPVVTSQEGEYEIGKLYTLKEGSDVVIFAIGVMVAKALEAAEKLEEQGISAKVVNVSTIKPLDRQAVLDCVRGCKGVVTAEEHNIIGGLGSAISEALRRERNIPVEFVGINDRFGTSAQDYDILLEKYGLTPGAIIDAVNAVIE